ncbi:MAG: hypothetical protein WB420_14495 [Bradyrhizobium sp.]
MRLSGPAREAQTLFPRAIAIDLGGNARIIDGDTIENHGSIACENALLDSRSNARGEEISDIDERAGRLRQGGDQTEFFHQQDALGYLALL